MAPTTPPPPGYNSVTPRMVVSDVVAEVGFLRAVFDATGEVVSGRPAEMLRQRLPDRPSNGGGRLVKEGSAW